MCDTFAHGVRETARTTHMQQRRNVRLMYSCDRIAHIYIYVCMHTRAMQSHINFARMYDRYCLANSDSIANHNSWMHCWRPDAILSHDSEFAFARCSGSSAMRSHLASKKVKRMYAHMCCSFVPTQARCTVHCTHGCQSPDGS